MHSHALPLAFVHIRWRVVRSPPSHTPSPSARSPSLSLSHVFPRSRLHTYALCVRSRSYQSSTPSLSRARPGRRTAMRITSTHSRGTNSLRECIQEMDSEGRAPFDGRHMRRTPLVVSRYVLDLSLFSLISLTVMLLLAEKVFAFAIVHARLCPLVFTPTSLPSPHAPPRSACGRAPHP